MLMPNRQLTPEAMADRHEEERAMTKVTLELSMSLDGYVTSPGVSPEAPMDRGGEALHDWMFEGRSAAEIQTSRPTTSAASARY
jgi:hypothetical protein